MSEEEETYPVVEMPDEVGPVQVVDSRGRVSDVRGEQLGAAIATGYLPATAEEVIQHDQRVGYLREGHALEAAAVGLAGGLTAGLSNAVLSQTEYADKLKDLYKYRSTMIGAGEITGGVIGAASGGLLGVPMKALATPAHALATTLRGTIGKRAAGMLAGGVEGASFAATQNIGEQLARGEAPVSSEQLFAAVGLGGLIGGSLGGVFNMPVSGKVAGMSDAATSRARVLFEDLADRSSRGLPIDEKALDNLTKMFRAYGSLQTQELQRDFKRLVQSTDADGKAFYGYRMAKNADEITSEIAKTHEVKIPNLIDETSEVGEKVQSFIRNKYAKQSIEKMDSQVALAAAVESAESLEALLRLTHSGKMISQLRGDILPVAYRRDLVKALSKDVNQIRHLAVAGKAHEAAQRSFSRLSFYDQELSAIFRDARKKAQTSPARSAINTAEGQEITENMTNLVKGSLLNEKTWGDVAAKLKESSRLARREIEAKRLFKKYFIDAQGNPRSSLTAFFEGGGKNARRQYKFDTFNELMEAKKEYLDFIENSGLEVKNSVDIKGTRSYLEKLSDDMAKAQEALDWKDTLKGIRHAEHESVGQGHMTGLIGALGGAINIPLGFALSTVSSFGRSPTNSLATLFQISEALGKQTAKWDDGVTKLATNSVKAARPALAAAGKAKDRLLDGRRRYGSTVNRFQELKRERDFDRRYAELSEMRGAKERMGNEMWAKVFGDPAFQNAAVGAGQVAGLAIDHILSKAPNKLEGYNVSPTEKSRFNAAFNGVTEPYSLMDALSQGNLDFRAAQAVRVVYPEEYDLMRSRVIDLVADMRSSGKTLPRRKLNQLGLAFGLRLDARVNPQYIQVMNEANPLGEENQKQGVPELHNTYENTSEVVGTRMEH